MIKQPVKNLTYNITRRGISLAEVAIASLLIGLMAVGTMNSVGAILRGRTKTVDQVRAQYIAQQLMTEILNENYIEPTQSQNHWGPELFEWLIGDPYRRSLFDDIDDFKNVDHSPPRDKEGDIIPDLTGWKQTADIQRVDPADPSVVVATESGVKRITITIKKNDVVLATLVALKTDASTELDAP